MEMTIAPRLGEASAATSTDSPASSAERRFESSLLVQGVFIAREALRREVLIEAATVLAAFDEAEDEVGEREALALAGLLGRRVAELGCTGTELDAVSEALLTAIAPSVPSGVRGIMIEGYARALIDREAARSLAAQVATTRPFVVEPHLLALVLQGEPQPEWLAACGQLVGPLLMRHDIRALLVVGRFNADSSAAAAAELASLVDLGAIVGARVIFDLEATWADALRERVSGRCTIVSDSTMSAFELAQAETAPVRAKLTKLLRHLGG